MRPLDEFIRRDGLLQNSTSGVLVWIPTQITAPSAGTIGTFSSPPSLVRPVSFEMEVGDLFPQDPDPAEGDASDQDTDAPQTEGPQDNSSDNTNQEVPPGGTPPSPE